MKNDKPKIVEAAATEAPKEMKSVEIKMKTRIPLQKGGSRIAEPGEIIEQPWAKLVDAVKADKEFRIFSPSY